MNVIVGRSLGVVLEGVDSELCDLPCQGANGATCGGNFMIQLYTEVPRRDRMVIPLVRFGFGT